MGSGEGVFQGPDHGVYLNNVYFANGYYGIQAASKGYFDKDAKDLTMSEAAFLCAVPNAPNMYEPYHHKEKTLTRRDKILKDMYKQNLITKSQRDEALREKITLKKKKTEQKRNYIETYVIHSATKALMEKQGFEFRYVFDSDEDKQDYDENIISLMLSVREPYTVQDIRFIHPLT